MRTKPTDHPKPWRCELYGPGHQKIVDADGKWVAQMLAPLGTEYAAWKNTPSSEIGTPIEDLIAKYERDPVKKALLDKAREEIRPLVDAIKASAPSAIQDIPWACEECGSSEGFTTVHYEAGDADARCDECGSLRTDESCNVLRTLANRVDTLQAERAAADDDVPIQFGNVNTTPGDFKRPDAEPVDEIWDGIEPQVEAGSVTVPESVQKWIRLLAEWEDRNGAMAGILEDEAASLVRSMANLAVTNSPRNARNAMLSAAPQSAPPEEGTQKGDTSPSICASVANVSGAGS